MNDSRSENQHSRIPTGRRTIIEQYEEAGFVVTTISHSGGATHGFELETDNDDAARSARFSNANRKKIRLLLGPGRVGLSK